MTETHDVGALTEFLALMHQAPNGQKEDMIDRVELLGWRIPDGKYVSDILYAIVELPADRFLEAFDYFLTFINDTKDPQESMKHLSDLIEALPLVLKHEQARYIIEKTAQLTRAESSLGRVNIILFDLVELEASQLSDIVEKPSS